MSYQQQLLRMIVLAVAATASCALQAQELGADDAENTQQTASKTTWGLGVGGGIATSPYRGIASKTSLLPLILYDSPYLHFLGTTADIKLGSVDSFDFTLRAKYANGGYKSSDASDLNGMAERKEGFWLGGSAVWRTPYGRLSLAWLKDASGYSHGQTFDLQAGSPLNVGRVKLMPFIGMTWMSSDYVDYYYGVKQSEATAARAAYAGKSTVNANLGVRVDYSLTAKESLFLEPRLTSYGSGITDSPLVDRSSSLSLRLGYLYKF